MPTLRKLEIEEGKTSALWAGYESNLPSMKLIAYDPDTEEQTYDKVIESIQDVEVGKQVLLYSLTEFHRTSPIREIIEKKPGRVLFKTQTSVYELTEKVEPCGCSCSCS